ncbi:MAG: tRNA epoxyqueuosine(34) reductase QueG [Acidobacteriia bacterium]|nr:tRNA epoxyqueuosine(34) reductase QueG [Terriglobia bacterium]
MNNVLVKSVAQEAGFELAGVAAITPELDFSLYREWAAQGRAGKMGYLTDRRADLRRDPRSLLPTARSILCVGKLYNGPQPHTNQMTDDRLGWISRYAWGEDYHPLMRSGLERIVAHLQHRSSNPFDYKICVDTAPLLERSYARAAGLGWIGRNTCLIHQGKGSWFFLAELLTSLDLEPDAAPPDRCGTCTRCIDACPTQALVPDGAGRFTLDARLCISYFTIELRGEIPEEHRAGLGQHVFGCDICQDVCPWNRQADDRCEPAYQPHHFAPPLAELAALTEDGFRNSFRGTPVTRAGYTGFLRNVAVAMGNSRQPEFGAPLRKLAAHPDPVVAAHAAWALRQLESTP